MRRIFKLKILRQKQTGMTLTIFLVGILFLAASYYRLKDEWLGYSWKEADSIRAQIENAIEQEERILDIQLNGVYASEMLLRDMVRLFGADSREAYLAGRLEDSRTAAQPIRSFPNYIRNYIREFDSTLCKVGLESMGRRNVIDFEMVNVRMEFDLPEESLELQENIAKNISVSRSMYDVAAGYEEIGQITFFFDAERLISMEEPEELNAAALSDRNGNLFVLKGEDEAVRRGVDKIREQGGKTGRLKQSALSSSYFYVLDFPKYGYELIVSTDDEALLRNHWKELLPHVIFITAISTIFLFGFYVSIRYDYKFINHIYEAIGSVNRGEFEQEILPALTSYRFNEYGQIAKELDEMCSRLKRHILKEYELKIRQQETQMLALQNQINPHFLYNTLEVIRSIALVNNDREAAEAMTALGALYREIVKESGEFHFSDEIELLKKYLKLMQFKCMGNFFYQIHVDDEMLKLKTVKFWMQPLSENFFVHGFEAERPCNVLVIEGSSEADGYLFEMVDNGGGIPEEDVERINLRLLEESNVPEKSIGLGNVYQRLRYFYGDGLTMKLSNNEEGGTKVTVWIPKGEEDV